MGNTVQTPPPPPLPQEHHRIKDEEEFFDADEENGGEGGDESFTCEICIEPTKKLAHHGVITSCTHQYCVDCMAKYVKVKIEDDSEPRIECPAPDCTHTLDPVACAPLVGPATFVRWRDALCRSALSGADDTCCYCPNPNCSELLFSDCKNNIKRKNNKRRQCPMCKKWLCFACKKVWHAGFGCGDAPKDGADVAFGRLAERMTWKRCPNCRHFVERRGGCWLVKCRCGIKFCYKCGKKILDGGWCTCDKSFQRCCVVCWIGFFIILAIVMIPLVILLHNKHKHAAHN